MFCPQCKAEYRQGVAECADCQVPLVASLPEGQEILVDTVSAGTLIPLWEGQDLALHTSLLQELDAASIPYFNKPTGVFPGARRGDAFPIQAMTRFGYQVAVLSSNLARARAILEKLVDEEPGDLELPERNEPAKTAHQALEEEPTWEVWIGPDDEFASFLQNALRENEILLRVECVDGESRVFVQPCDAPRAKEILRELNEGSPPR
jgi:hypothetical protein